MFRLFIILSFILLSGCQREKNDYQSEGTITGYDYRMCMCCGGWFVEIGDSTWRFDQIPEGCTIILDSVTFPLPVYLDWEKKNPPCLGDEIVVERMIARSQKSE
jgi:hypothetical protein